MLWHLADVAGSKVFNPVPNSPLLNHSYTHKALFKAHLLQAPPSVCREKGVETFPLQSEDFQNVSHELDLRTLLCVEMDFESVHGPDSHGAVNKISLIYYSS